MQNTYFIDLIIDKEDRLKVLEMHGNSGSYGSSKEAGYGNSAIKRHLKGLIKKNSREGPVLYLVRSSLWNPNEFPRVLEELYESLPPSVAHTSWREGEVAAQQRRQGGEFSGKIGQRMVRRLQKAGNDMRLDLRVGIPTRTLARDELEYYPWGHGDFDYRERIPIEDVRFLALHVGDDVYYPHEAFHYPDTCSLPLLNDVRVHHLLSGFQPKWMLERVLDGAYPELFPRTAYVGMGYGRADEVIGVTSRSSSGIVAVKKPLMTHQGIGVKYLRREEFDGVVRDVVCELDVMREHRDVLTDFLVRGVPYSNDDCDRMANPWRIWSLLEDGRILMYPFAQLGMSIVQEFLDPAPVLSRRTGELHQGSIRAIFDGTALRAAFYRFPVTPYRSDAFTPITAVDEPTFYERVSDVVEDRVQNSLWEMIRDFSEAAGSSDPCDLRFDIAAMDDVTARILE